MKKKVASSRFLKSMPLQKPAPTHSSSRAWIYFHLFFAVNLFLSYSSFPYPFKWSAGLITLALGLTFYFKKMSLAKTRDIPFYSREWVSPSVGWILGIVALSIGLRFFKFTSFFTYPLYDDVLNAFFAFHLDQHWTWHPFFYYSQIPPLYIWLLAGLFKAGTVSTFSLWLLPALLSLLCVPLSYVACRTLFSKSLSWICCLLTAASFWPLWLSRISHQMGLMVLWEWLAFWALGKFCTASPLNSRRRSIFLGLCVGGGFYTYFAWPVIACFVTVIVLFWSFRTGKKSSIIPFFTSAFLAVFPLLAAAFQSHFGYYVTHRWLLKGNQEWDVFHSFYYITTLFWEGWKGYFGYAPRWGGFLNPILGAFFAIGLGEAWRFRRKPLVWAFGGSLLLFLVPVLLTDNFSASRLTPLLPVCLIGSAWGAQTLGLTSGPVWKKIYFPLLFIISLFLDSVNLSQTRSYTNDCKEGPKYVRYTRAYDVLSQLSKNGTGAVFLNFINDTRDRSLAFLSFPFNPVVNDQVSIHSISWAAVLADDEYRPGLNQSFPGIQWEWLDWDMRDMEGSIYFVRGIYLGIIPLSDANRCTIQNWLKAGHDLEEIALMDLNYVPPRSHGPILTKLSEFYEDFEKNRLLRTFFWEKVADDYAEDGNYDSALEAVDKAIQAGDPRGYLYHQKGQWLVRMKRYGEARRAFQEAGRLDIRFVPSEDVLKLLDHLENQSLLVLPMGKTITNPLKSKP
jgi:hypothetical protein